MDLSHRDFIFPFLRNNPIALQKWAVALAFCYSRRWNSRRLEDPSYGIWNLVLTNLTEDQATLLVIPQFMVWYVDNPKHAPDISFRTTAEHDAEERIPDFVIARISTHPPPSLANIRRLEDFHTLKVQLVHLPVLIEVKRIPSRRLAPKDFELSLTSTFQSAELDLDRQASYLVKCDTYIHQESVILIGCVGEWWRWKVVTRDVVEKSVGNVFTGTPFCEDGDPLPQGEQLDDDEEDDLLEIRYRDPLSGSESDEDDELNITDRQRQISVYEEVDYDDAGDAWPREWSSNIRLGTPASNQRFYLLHRYLTQLL